MSGFTTRAIHSPASKRDPHGALRVPVYDSAAFEFDKSEDLQFAFEGKKIAHVYSRSSNPTVEDFERRVCALAEASSAIAVSSGTAAITNVIWTLAGAGTNIVVSPYLFGNTFSLFESTFKSWGLKTRFVNFMEPAEVDAAIDDQTRAVFCEVITNPQLQVAPLREISRIAHKHGIPVILDGTLTSLYLFNSKSHGADLEVLSTTKYISGGGTSIGGLILDNGTFDWHKSPKISRWAEKFGPLGLTMAMRKEIYRNLGSCLSPHNAYLQSLGLETLALRIDRSSKNALALARFLESSSRVLRTHYPGLESSPYYGVAQAQFPLGFGGLVSFELKDKDSCFRVMDRLKIIRRATNLCDNKTLILHPASTIYAEFSPEEKARMGVPDSMVRLSVGIEDIEDLMEDLRAALEGM